MTGMLDSGPHRRRTWKLIELERQAIQSASEETGGNLCLAAELLGIDRSTLRRKLAHLNE